MVMAKKTATPTDEKFENQDFDLFKAIDAIDAKKYDWFSNLTDEQRKKFVPYMMTHWVSSIKKKDWVASYYVMSVDDIANKHLFNEHVMGHPELQWLMLCASSPAMGKQFHSWIPHLKDKVSQLKEAPAKKDIRDYFQKIYSGANAKDIELAADTYTEELKHQHKLATLYPNMKLDDIKALSEYVTQQDIKNYEADSGN
jgi:hypothetical protein